MRPYIIRDTSIEAYNHLKNNDLLSPRRWEFYEILFHFGPLTATQAAQKMGHSKSPSVGANAHARLGELRTMGLIQERGTVECPLTGMNVILWDVTSRKLPLPIPKKQKEHVCPHCHGRGYVS